MQAQLCFLLYTPLGGARLTRNAITNTATSAKLVIHACTRSEIVAEYPNALVPLKISLLQKTTGV